MTHQSGKTLPDEVLSQQGPSPPLEQGAAPRPDPIAQEEIPAEHRPTAGPESERQSDPSPIDPGSLARLGGIQVKAAVELGAAELLVRDLAALGPGSVVRLDRLMGEPADLTVNGRLFARGEVVIVEDRLGLRITRLTNAGEPVADRS